MKHFSKINYLAVGLASILLFSGCGKVVDTYPVDVLKNETTTSPILTATTTDSALSPQKIEVTSENWAEHDKEFATLVASGQDPNLNTEPTTTTVPYINFEQGFEVQIPYSKNWGTEKMYPKPFEFFNPKSGILPPYLIKFGPLVVTGEGEVGLGRPYFIALSKHRDIDQVESDFKKEISGYDLGSDKWPSGEKLTINGLSIFHGMHSILCEHHEFEVVGKNYNVIVGTMCDDSQEAEKVLLQVVKSMKFFDKIVLNEKNLDQILEHGVCYPKFRTDAPNSMVPYRNSDKGIQIGIPYNKNWTYGVLVLAPYFDDSEYGYIHFGPAFPLYSSGAGCDIERTYKLSFLPLTSIDKTIGQVKEKVLVNNQKIEIHKKVVGNLSVVEIDFYELTDQPNFPAHRETYVVGNKYTYKIENYGHIPPVEEVEKIISTIKLI